MKKSSRGTKRLKKTTSFQIEEDEESDNDMPLLEDDQDIVVGGSENEDSASENSQNEDEDSEREEDDARTIINSRPRRNLNFDDIDFDNMVRTLCCISLKKMQYLSIICVRKLMKLVRFLVSK